MAKFYADIPFKLYEDDNSGKPLIVRGEAVARIAIEAEDSVDAVIKINRLFRSLTDTTSGLPRSHG